MLLVDDCADFRHLVEVRLTLWSRELQVVGHAEHGIAALRLTARLDPDIVLMDLNMPRMDGVEATALLTQVFPRVEIVGSSSAPDRDRLVKAGATAAYHKDDLDGLVAHVCRGLRRAPDRSPSRVFGLRALK